MSHGERSPKRQRLESYSPASPPLTSDTKPFVPPQTPPPSVRMSPSWQSQSQTTTSQSSGVIGSFPTPPSTAGFQSQMAGRGAGSDTDGESGRQTPASETDNDIRRDGDGDAEMTDRNDATERDFAMAEGDHRRSDHERKGAAEDVMPSIPGTQSLYKLSAAPVAPSQPHASHDFIDLYDLKRIQASVARRDPVSGEKINKLRKSYENKVKALGLEGRNKAQANLGDLQGLLDPAWNTVVEGSDLTWWDGKVNNLMQEGKALNDANSQKDLTSKLQAALDMLPGRLPPKEYREWQNMLGLDDIAVPAKTAITGTAKPAAGIPSAIAKTAPTTAARNSAPSSPHNGFGRPGRTGSKRRYDDSSFEGYTGYDDDGYSTGGMDDSGRRGSNAKRQKRKVSAKLPGFYSEYQV